MKCQYINIELHRVQGLLQQLGDLALAEKIGRDTAIGIACNLIDADKEESETLLETMVDDFSDKLLHGIS